MSREFQRIVVLAVAVALACVSAPAFAQASAYSPSSVYVPSARLMTMDGTVLWERKPDLKRRPASTIKMLNALVARENASLDQTITISRHAEKVDEGIVGLRAGQVYTVRQLLSIALVVSSNGCAEALADGIGGSEAKYVAMMNAKAQALGLTHTRAYDPHGLSPLDTSTAADLSVIARQLMADPVLRGIVRMSRVKVPRGKGSHEWYSTTDELLGAYPGIEGIKTGYTDAAGYCFVGAAKRHGVELLGVVLGADTLGDRFGQMRNLLNWGFAHTKSVRVVSCEETMGAVEVSEGSSPTVTVHADRALSVAVCDATGTVTTQVVLPASLKAPISAGQRVGSVRVLRSGLIVASVPLVADSHVGATRATMRTSASLAEAEGGASSLWRRIAQVVAGFGRMLGI